MKDFLTKYFRWAIGERGAPTAEEALEFYANPKNWVQVYDGKTSPAATYEAKACEWAFIGGVRPPYEAAQKVLAELEKEEEG